MFEIVMDNYQRNSKSAKIKIICDFISDTPLVSCVDTDLKALSQDLKSIYEAGDFSDLKLKVANDTAAVHAAIIKARSRYVYHILNENRELRGINLTEKISFEELKCLITYWYSCDFENFPRTRGPSSDNIIINMKEPVLKSYIDPETVKLTTAFRVKRETVSWVIDNNSFI